MMDNVLSEIQNKMKKGAENTVFPGAVYAILYKEKLIIDVVGNKSLLPTLEGNKLDTIYDLASLTKVIVTNFLIGKLVEEGTIKLTDPVRKYIPEFKHEDITVVDLLTHSSGLPANINWMNVKTKDDYLELIFNVDKKEKRHSKAIYSDIGFIILGLLIEKVANQKLDTLANNLIFKKLNMTDTTYNPINIDRCAPTEKEGDIYIKGIVHDKKARLFDGVAGHAGVFSTVFDLVKYAKMILDEGVYKGNQIISKEIINLWYKPIIQDSKGRYRTIAWIKGTGSDVVNPISKKVIYHTGFTGNRMLIDKDNELAIILLSNRVHPTRDNNKLKIFWPELVSLIYEKLIINKEGDEVCEKIN